MANLSMLDLQNLRHLIGGFDTTHCKMQAYAEAATDPSVKNILRIPHSQHWTANKN